MRPRTAGVVIAVLAGAVLALPRARAAAPRHVPLPLPPVAGTDVPGLPALPEVSPRNASYTIEARLDPEKRTIAGTLLLEWRNTSDQPLSTFPFHLYWNAFRNNLSTTARGEGRRAPEDRQREERSFGWIEVRTVRLVGDPGQDGAVPDRVGRAHAPRQHRAGGLGARLPLRRAVVPQDRRVLEGRVELPPVLPLDGVLLRFRRLRREAHPAEGVRSAPTRYLFWLQNLMELHTVVG